MRAIEFLVRMFAMVVMLVIWGTIGLFICTILSMRSLLWMSGKTLVFALLNRPLPSVEQFTATVMLWPCKAVEFVDWGFSGDKSSTSRRVAAPRRVHTGDVPAVFFRGDCHLGQ
jgi:hypothetical protein